MRVLLVYVAFCLTFKLNTSYKYLNRRYANSPPKRNQDENKIRNIDGFEAGSTSPRCGASAPSFLPSIKFGANQIRVMRACTGGFSGTVAAFITNPVEVIKTQLQSSNACSVDGIASIRKSPMPVIRQILKDDGVSGFYRGLLPFLVGVIPSSTAYFYAYERTKHSLLPIFPDGSVMNAMISGLAAGLASKTLTNPIWFVRTRMQLNGNKAIGQYVYKGYGDCIFTIFREDGIPGFYRGICASYWGCAENIIQFVLYEQLKTRLLKRKNARRKEQDLPPASKISKIALLSSAAFAKGVAAAAAYPHEVARTRLREQARSGILRQAGMWGTLNSLARDEGFRGLYTGLSMRLLEVVPNTGFMFLTYELVTSWLNHISTVEELNYAVE